MFSTKYGIILSGMQEGGFFFGKSPGPGCVLPEFAVSFIGRYDENGFALNKGPEGVIGDEYAD